MSVKQIFCCPHCGGDEFSYDGVFSKTICVVPPQNERAAHVENPDIPEVEYGHFTCIECGEELDIFDSAFADLFGIIVKHEQDAAHEFGKVRFI